jgi:hypothetical protein
MFRDAVRCPAWTRFATTRSTPTSRRVSPTDTVEVYVQQKRLAEAVLSGESKDSILRKTIRVALAMGMKHSSLSGQKLRTVDEIFAAIEADGKVNLQTSSLLPEILDQLKEVGKSNGKVRVVS